jgi:hypothetical protein
MEDKVTLGSGCRRAGTAWLCLGASFAFATIVATLLVAQSQPPTRAANLLLIYVGADDCAPCRAWYRSDGAAFRSTADFSRITYREVKSPQLNDVLEDQNWPEDIRSYRGYLKRSDGVPLWLVILDDKIVERRFGIAAWRSKILPRVRLSLR